MELPPVQPRDAVECLVQPIFSTPICRPHGLQRRPLNVHRLFHGTQRVCQLASRGGRLFKFLLNCREARLHLFPFLLEIHGTIHSNLDIAAQRSDSRLASYRAAVRSRDRASGTNSPACANLIALRSALKVLSQSI
jgi:hypothetical protein